MCRVRFIVRLKSYLCPANSIKNDKKRWSKLTLVVFWLKKTNPSCNLFAYALHYSYRVFLTYQ